MIAYLYLAFVILVWASSPAVVKLLLRGLDNFQVLFFITLFASVFLFIIAFLQRKLHLLRTYSSRDFLIFSCMGFLGVFLYFVFFFGSLSLIPAQITSIVNYTWPVLVLVFASLILKERLTLRKLFALFISFIGVVIVISQGDLSFDNFLGVLLALGGACSYSLFSVLGKKLDYDQVVSMMIYYVVSLLLSIIAVLLFSDFVLPSLASLVGLLWLGCVTSGIAYVAWFAALKYGDTAKIANLVYLTPFLALVYIRLLLGESITFASIIGLLVVVIGILIQVSRRN